MLYKIELGIGDFVFPNGDEYSGGYISGENGIQMSGYGTWTSKQVNR